MHPEQQEVPRCAAGSPRRLRRLLNTLVLNSTEQALSNALKINPDQFGAGAGNKKVDRQVNAYWKSHLNSASQSNG